MKLTANELLKLKIIDEIIEEPFGGAHRNKDHIIVYTRKVLIKYLEEFKKFSRGEILEQRKEKFLNIGKQKAFTVFLKEAAWIEKSNFLVFIKKILLKFKKELIIIALLIFIVFLFLV